MFRPMPAPASADVWRRVHPGALVNLLGLFLVLAGAAVLDVCLWHVNGWAGAALLGVYAVGGGVGLMVADVGESN